VTSPALAQAVVISRGNPKANLMLIGEAPGAQEDAQGAPFVGRSGRALDQLLRDVDLDPEHDLYICNAIKCRPTEQPTTEKS
jgi:DNA polymerase